MNTRHRNTRLNAFLGPRYDHVQLGGAGDLAVEVDDDALQAICQRWIIGRYARDLIPMVHVRAGEGLDLIVGWQIQRYGEDAVVLMVIRNDGDVVPVAAGSSSFEPGAKLISLLPPGEDDADTNVNADANTNDGILPA